MLEKWESTKAEIIFAGTGDTALRKQTFANVVENPDGAKLLKLGGYLKDLAPETEQLHSVVTATRKRLTPETE